MFSFFLKKFKPWLRLPKQANIMQSRLEQIQMNLGRIQSELHAKKEGLFPADYEYQVFSQSGEDGIIEYLLRTIHGIEPCFIEFGVQNYCESNTRFLLKNRNWSGLVIDADPRHIEYIKNDDVFWRHDLRALCSFITAENINSLIDQHKPSRDVGLLSIDIDGNDYWVWQAITCIQPTLVITEYNYRFGPTWSATIPYDSRFNRETAHYSNVYYGASLTALWRLAQSKGYDLVGCNMCGNNAFWIRKDRRPANLAAQTPEKAYQMGKFRESKDEHGHLNYLSLEKQQAILRELPLVEINP